GGGERVARVHRVALVVHAAVAVPLADVRPGDDLDLGATAAFVVVGRERAGAEADLTDLVAVRQTAAAEAVHHEGGAARARHLLQHFGELVGIVGLFRDLG